MELKDLKNAWLNPKGKLVTKSKEFYGDSLGWHDQLSYCILRDMWKLESSLDAFNKVHTKFSNYGYVELENLGWIRLHGYGGLTPKWIIPYGKKLTKKQEETILEWCLHNNVNFNNCFSV